MEILCKLPRILFSFYLPRESWCFWQHPAFFVLLLQKSISWVCLVQKVFQLLVTMLVAYSFRSLLHLSITQKGELQLIFSLCCIIFAHRPGDLNHTPFSHKPFIANLFGYYTPITKHNIIYLISELWLSDIRRNEEKHSEVSFIWLDAGVLCVNMQVERRGRSYYLLYVQHWVSVTQYLTSVSVAVTVGTQPLGTAHCVFLLC